MFSVSFLHPVIVCIGIYIPGLSCSWVKARIYMIDLFQSVLNCGFGKHIKLRLENNSGEIKGLILILLIWAVVSLFGPST